MLFEIITEYHWDQYNYGGPHFKNILQDVLPCGVHPA